MTRSTPTRQGDPQPPGFEACRRHRCAAVLVALALLGGSTRRAAATPGAPEASGPATASPNSTLPVSCDALTTLRHVTCELGTRLPAIEDAIVVVQTSRGGPDGTKQQQLSQRVGNLLRSYVRAENGNVAATLSTAQFRARRHRHLIWLQPVLDAGRLDVTLDVYESKRGFWERVKSTAPGPLHHDFATGPLDPEIRSFIPTRPLVVTSVHVAKLPVPRAYALACGDVDADSALDIAVADRHSIVVGHVVADRFESTASTLWADVAPVAPAPLREPIMMLSVPRGGGLEVGSTDRSGGRGLNGKLSVVRDEDALLPWPGVGCVPRSGLGLSGKAQPCSPGREPPSGPPPALTSMARAVVDTIAGDSTVDGDGKPMTVAALRTLDSSEVQLFDSRGHQALIQDAGAQVAVGDLDFDGMPELAVSKNTFDREADSVRVFTWKHPRLEMQFELPVPGGVDAIALCPSEGRTQATLLVSSGDEVWAIR